MGKTEEKTEETIAEVKKELAKDKKSQATRIKHLMYRHQQWMKIQYQTTEFKEPVMLFERRSGEVEFYENVTSGLFEYTHSDGTVRFLILTPQKQKKFGFADRRFKGYICHEDYPLPLPQDPLLTTDQMNSIVEKSLNDMKKWKAQEKRATGKMWLYILGGIALIIVAIALLQMLIPQKSPQTVQVIKDTSIAVINASRTVMP